MSKASELIAELRYGCPPAFAGAPLVSAQMSQAADLLEAQAKAIEEMRVCLVLCVEQMGGDAVQIDGEWGIGRSLDELEAANELPDALVKAKALIASHSKGGE